MQTTVTALDWQMLVAAHGEQAQRVYALRDSLARKWAACADTCERLSARLAEIETAMKQAKDELDQANADANYWSVAATMLNTSDQAELYANALTRAECLLARVAPTLDDEQAALVAAHATYVGHMR